MIVSIIGIDKTLPVYEGDLSLLNIKNTLLYRSLVKFLLNDLSDLNNNSIVVFDGGERLNPKTICYIHDLYSYKFDNKTILDKIIKPYLYEMNTFVASKEKETNLYQNIIGPLIEYINTLGVEYEYSEELDPNFYSKIPGINFSLNNNLDEIDKILSIINVESKILKKRFFIINGIFKLLTENEIEELKTFIKQNNIYLLLIDSIDENEVVSMNNLCISNDFGTFSQSFE